MFHLILFPYVLRFFILLGVLTIFLLGIKVEVPIIDTLSTADLSHVQKGSWRS